jgi:2-polyprenyl-6-methoxyphenol hydroxylase-like FAD-dependent oxidoreductase
MSDRGVETMIPVVVVGAGPAGLAASIELARRDVPVVLVDRRTEHSPLPRATVASTRTMELIRSWGLADEMLAGSVDVSWEGWICETLATAEAGSPMPVGYPTPEQAAVVSPMSPACVPQDHLEPVLLAHLRGHPVVDVRRGTEVVALSQDPRCVVVTLRDRGSGELSQVHAAYAIGADGASSVVRTSLGIRLRGPDSLAHSLTVLFRAPELWQQLGPRRHGIYAVTAPTATGTFLPAGRDDRWIYGCKLDPDQEGLADYPPDRLVGLIRAGAGIADLTVEIEQVGAFSFAAQIVDTYRVGRILLAGDAAHRISPRGGTGMNTAIYDGFDLGWKLAWVLRGWADAGLLDSYETERRPIGLHNTERSADPLGSLRDVWQVLPYDLGGRIPHVWVSVGKSVLDLVGPGLTLITNSDGAAWQKAASLATGSMPLDVLELDSLVATAVGVSGSGALLVRPDGRPLTLWPDDHRASELVTTVERLLGRCMSAAA